MRINLLSFFAVSREDKEMIIKVVGDNPKFLEVSTEYILKKCISCYNYKTGQYWDTSVEQVVIAYCNEVNNCIRLVPQTYTSGLYIRLVPQACTYQSSQQVEFSLVSRDQIRRITFFFKHKLYIILNNCLVLINLSYNIVIELLNFNFS